MLIRCRRFAGFHHREHHLTGRNGDRRRPRVRASGDSPPGKAQSCFGRSSPERSGRFLSGAFRRLPVDSGAPFLAAGAPAYPRQRGQTLRGNGSPAIEAAAVSAIVISTQCIGHLLYQERFPVIPVRPQILAAEQAELLCRSGEFHREPNRGRDRRM